QRIQREKNIPLARNERSAKGGVEKILLPDSDGEKLVCCGSTVGGRTAREKSVRNRILDLVAIAHDVVLVELNDPVEFAHPVNVTIGNLRLNHMLVAFVSD